MYKIVIEKKAADFLRKTDKSLREQIIKKIEKLKQEPLLGIPLLGSFSGTRKLRIGQYRVIYRVISEKIVILVLDIGHRKNIYK